MADAQRGVVYTQKVVSDESVAREMTALADRGQAIQKMLGGFRLGGLDLSQFQTGVDRAHASLEALHKLALQPAAIGAPTMAPAPGVVSQLATYPAATLPPAVSMPPRPTLPAAEAPGAPELPTGEFGNLKGDLENIVSAHQAAEEKLTSQTSQGAQAREAANAAAAKVQAQQEAELTASAAAENEKRAALPDRVVRNRIAMLARLQKFEADKEAGEQKAAEKQAAQLQKTAEAERKAAEKQAAAAQKAADKQTAAAQQAAEKETAVAAKVAERRQAQLEKQTEADKKYWDSFVKFGEESQKKRAEQNERAAEEHERAVRKLEHANIRLRRSLTEALVGTTELARGFTELGLVGEEDMEKIKDAILGVQSAVDLIHGGVGVWNALAESAQLYQERLVLIKEAEEAAAAAHAATSTGGAVSSAAGAATAAGAAGGVGGLVSGLGSIVMAINPVTAGLLALGAAVGYVFYAFHKQDEELKAAAEKEKQAREAELDVREQQNHALLQIFAAEKQARQQTGAREALALKVSQEFGAKRGEYEAEAARRGLKGQAAQQSVADQAALDQNRLALEQAKREQAEGKKYAERSRQASTGEGPLAVPRESEAVTAAEQDRLEEIRREREQLQARMRASEAQGDTKLVSFGMQTNYGRDRERSVELSLEENKLRHQDRPARGVNQFAADEAAETRAAQEAEALRQKIVELEERGAELSREQFRHEVSALNEELQKQQELVAGDKERLKSAKEYAAQQHAALQSALSGFAQLTAVQRTHLVEIQHKLDRGEKLTQKEEEFGAQHLGAKGKRQIAEQQAERARNELGGQDLKALFGEELDKDAQAQKQLAQATKENTEALQQLNEVLGRVAELNKRAEGGEKAEINIDAQGHAELTVKWDQQSSALIAKAIKPELAKWQGAIDEMLEKAKAEIESTFKRTIQRKAQKGAAGAG